MLTLEALSILTIIRNGIKFPRLVYINIKFSLLKNIIKHDRVDVLQCIDYKKFIPKIWKKRARLYKWNAIRCFCYLQLHTLDAKHSYVEAKDYFNHKRFIAGYGITTPVALTREEAYLVICRNDDKFIEKYKEADMTIPFVWPLELEESVARRLLLISSPIADPSKVTRYVNNTTVHSDVVNLILRKYKTNNTALIWSLLIKKLNLNLITANDFIIITNDQHMQYLPYTPVQYIQQIARHVDIFQLHWSIVHTRLNTDLVKFLLEQDDCAFNATLYNDAVRYLKSKLISFSTTAMISSYGGDIKRLLPFIKIDNIKCYLRYGGKLLDIIKNTDISLDNIGYNFETKLDKIEAITYYCSIGDLNTIKYIVSGNIS